MEVGCPSFMTVEQTQESTRSHRKISRARERAISDIATPVLQVDPDGVDIRMIGIGGTGVVTASQIIATAAMLDGFDVR
jgi:indolepyruvate ferredoxin oxidoreductase